MQQLKEIHAVTVRFAEGLGYDFPGAQL